MILQENIDRIKQIMKVEPEKEDQRVKYDAVLVGGLDNRVDKKGKLIDKTLDEQVELLKQGFGKEKNVKGFRYNTDTSEILMFLKLNPKIPVFLFSAGCKKSLDISKSPYSDKDKIYIIEPYGSDNSETKKIVVNAVSNGIPSKHVFVGTHPGTGLGIVNGAVSSGAKDHWSALWRVGSQKKF